MARRRARSAEPTLNRRPPASADETCALPFGTRSDRAAVHVMVSPHVHLTPGHRMPRVHAVTRRSTCATPRNTPDARRVILSSGVGGRRAAGLRVGMAIGWATPTTTAAAEVTASESSAADVVIDGSRTATDVGRVQLLRDAQCRRRGGRPARMERVPLQRARACAATSAARRPSLDHVMLDTGRAVHASPRPARCCRRERERTPMFTQAFDRARASGCARGSRWRSARRVGVYPSDRRRSRASARRARTCRSRSRPRRRRRELAARRRHG